MFKRIMSVMLAIVMLMSVAMVAASAAQVEITDNGADAIVDTGADAEVTDTAASNVIYFDTTNSGWKNFKKVYCHVWAYDGSGDWPSWQSKKESCTFDSSTGLATYDLTKTGNSFDAGVLYAVIFSTDTGMQTHNLLFGASVIGDTAYCKDPELKYENPEDSNKTSVAAFWKNQDETVYGPELGITSIGTIVGTCMPFTMSAQSMFEDFLLNKLENARLYANKDDQALLDDTAKALGLKQENVSEALANTKVTADWSADKSSLEAGKNEEADKKPDGSSTNPGGSGNTGGSGSGSGSASKTGQSTTMAYVMIAVMIAAAAAIVIARKRERA